MNRRAGRESERVIFAARTHTGHRRPHNEDAYAVVPELGLFVVADGMGGHEAGEVASRIVVDHVVEAVRDGETVADAASGAHEAVQAAVASGDGRHGMGATVVAARFQNDTFEVVWAGDSRAYRFGGELERMTRDHSLVQEMVDMGALSESDARHHPERSLITRAMGMPDADEMGVESLRGRLYAGQRLLLCSDGLTGELPDREIERLLREFPDPERAVDQLVDAALEAGGSDNITVVLVQATNAFPHRVRPWRLVLAALIGLGAAILAGITLALAGLPPFR